MFTKTTKTLVAALVLAGAAITFVANASAAPSQGSQPSQGSWQAEQNWMDRASAGGNGGA
jgi:Spy/CpxP family protein refolding chaperone